MEMENEHDDGITKSYKNIIHRDDYYLFLFVNTEEGVLTVDFEEMQVIKKSNWIC